MRPRVLPMLAAALSLLAAPAARAGGLLTATWTQELQGVTFVHTLTTGYGTSYLSNGATRISVSLTLPSFSDSAFVAEPDGLSWPVFVTAAAHGSQWILGSQGMVSATMGIEGSLEVHPASHTMGSMYVRLMTPVYRLPLSVGADGSATASFTLLGSYHYVTVDFYGWTTGTRTFTGLTSGGAPLPNVVAMGSWALSPVNPISSHFGGAGTITLVAPTRISIAGRAPRRTVSLSTLKLGFWSDGPYDTVPVPEPGALLLTAAGLALLATRRGSR